MERRARRGRGLGDGGRARSREARDCNEKDGPRRTHAARPPALPSDARSSRAEPQPSRRHPQRAGTEILMHSPSIRSLFLLVLLPLALGPDLLGQSTTGTPPQRKLAPFRVLDNVEGSHVDLMFAPVRPLLLDEAAGRLYALNTHDSRLHEFDAA